MLNAYVEVVNSMNRVENYRKSVELKLAQVDALDRSVGVASELFQGARVEFADVLFSQRDLLEARMDLIEAKQEQLSAIVEAYRALGGGFLLSNSGIEATEAFYLTPQRDLIETLPQPTPAANPDATTPDEEALPMDPDDAAPLPPGAEASSVEARPRRVTVPANGAAPSPAARTIPPPVKLEPLELTAPE